MAIPGNPGACSVYPPGTIGTPSPNSPPSPSSTPTKIASGVSFLTRGLIKGIHVSRDLAVGGIDRGSKKVMTKTRPKDKPFTVSTRCQNNVAQFRAATETAVVVTDGVATTVVGAATKAGSKVVNHFSFIEPENNKTVNGIKIVGRAVVGGATAVFGEATDAARDVLTASTASASDVVQHKYGLQAGALTRNALGIVTDSVNVATTFSDLDLLVIGTAPEQLAVAADLVHCYTQLGGEGPESKQVLSECTKPELEKQPTMEDVGQEKELVDYA